MLNFWKPSATFHESSTWRTEMNRINAQVTIMRTRRLTLKAVASLCILPILESQAKDEPQLRLFVQRKVINELCMQGYLSTQVRGENKPTVACYVLEKPPIDNAPYVSAIPAGTYPVAVRQDGKKGWRLELKDVPNRQNVQIHIGNYASDSVGCLLPGMTASPNMCEVKESAIAMNKLRALFLVFGENGRTTIELTDI